MVDTTGWSVRNKANPYFAKANHVKLAKNQATKRFIDSVVDQFLVVRALLFSSNEPGFFYDFDDWSTLFQDTAGAQPVTAANQGVALALDKSGNGNHATQATTAARPRTVIHPDGGVRNLLDRSEEFDDAVWGKSGSISVTPNSVIAPDGTLSADLLNSPGFNQLVRQSFVAASTTLVVSVFVRAGSTSTTEWVLLTAANELVSSGLIAGKLSGPGSISVLGGSRARVSGLTSEWTRFQYTYTGLTVGTTYRVATYVGEQNAGGSLGNIYFWGAQLEEGSTATPYQKRVNFLDVTEAGKRSIRRLYFNGTSHFMTTPVITPNTDKAQVFAGLRKLS
jgi:hypothetical protein